MGIRSAFVIACVLSAVVPSGAAAQADDIRIVSIDPSTPVAAGVETQLTIELDVILESDEEAVVRVGFNLSAPEVFRMIESHDIKKGRQRVTVAVSIVPVDWTERGDFSVMANVGPKAPQARWTATASVRKAIPVK